MIITATDLCTELRRCGNADENTMEAVASLMATRPQTIVPLLQSLRDCGIVEGTRFRTDVWAGLSSRGAMPDTYIDTRLLPPDVILRDEADIRRRAKDRERKARKKKEAENDLYYMAGI